MYAPSEKLTILAGDYSDLILCYRNTNAATLIFSGLFPLLGILIGLLSLGARASGAKRLRTLRYLSLLVLLVSLWISIAIKSCCVFIDQPLSIIVC